MTAFIDEQRTSHGIEPLCRQLPIAPSTYYEHKARQREPERHPARYQHDQWLKLEIQRVWDENMQVYGVRKVWRQRNRESIKVARCTVERLMNKPGIQGAIRGKKCWTTVSDAELHQPADLVDRQFFVCGQTSSGWRILLMSLPGRVLFMSPL